MDPAPECVEHVWRLVALDLVEGEGAFTEYVCVRCGTPSLIGPGGDHPQTV